MSDIGLLGFEGLAGAVATAAVGLVALLVMIFASLLGGASRRRRRLWLLGSGPAACFVVGCASMAIDLSLDNGTSDQLWFLWPALGAAAWIAATLLARRRAIHGAPSGAVDGRALAAGPREVFQDDESNREGN